MKKELVQEAVALTQECLTRYWQLDCEYVLRYCDKDVIWVGSLGNQFIEGWEATAADLRAAMREVKPCHLLRQEFTVVQNVGSACTVVGRYLTTTDDEVGYFLQVQQRCTFTWELEGGAWKIKHIHVSNPMGELKVSEGERFVNALGEMSKKYIQYRLASQQSGQRLVITDSLGTTYFIMPSEILYAMASGRDCILYMMSGGEIHARMGISSFLKCVGTSFFAVHRSYVVNKAYVSRIQQYELIMADGSKIPVPMKKFREIREGLAEIYKTQNR